MEDPFGHRISYLRVSVTDRCNERCRYCMPEEEQTWFAKEETLSYDELLRVVRVGATLGIKKIRVTGGEPLTRPGVAGFCAELARIPGIDEIGISTNGTLLAKLDGGITIGSRHAWDQGAPSPFAAIFGVTTEQLQAGFGNNPEPAP